jgi:hypothetical protein
MPTVVKVLGGYLEVDLGGTGGGQPPFPSQGPGFPTHPIAPGGSPPGIWGGGNMPYPDQGLPGPQPHPGHPISPGGQPPHPSQGPGFPTHPISPGGQPPGFWGGTPPIYIDIGPPGEQPQPPEDESKIEWHTGWSSEKGWVTVGIVTPEQPVPTPSS